MAKANGIEPGRHVAPVLEVSLGITVPKKIDGLPPRHIDSADMPRLGA